MRTAKRLVLLLVLALLGGCANAPAPPPAKATSDSPSDPAFAQLERQFGARLGVYVLDTRTGRTITYRADDRFAYASTYKVLMAGVALREDSAADLAHVVTYTTADLQSYSPVTAKHVATGMTVDDLIAAALQYSDNTAANLLLNQLGGPSGLRTALRGLGDTTTHVDRNEPTVNTATPGDIRDTSTPRALGTDLREFVLGNLLPASRREQLTSWLLGNTTGGPYVRAGVPAGWKVGDKTGNADYGTRNDIAIAWPPTGGPVVIAVESDRHAQDAASADALIADATKTGVAALAS
jgi:beta-lactamase class A